MKPRRKANRLNWILRIGVLLLTVPWGWSPQAAVLEQESHQLTNPAGELDRKTEEPEPRVQESGKPAAVESESDKRHNRANAVAANAETKPAKRWEFVGVPIPIIDPTVGNGLAGAGGALVRVDPRDTVSPPSLFGGGFAMTSNGTTAYGVMTELFLREDRFRITGIFGDGDVNYDYYGPGFLGQELGLFVPLSIDGLFFLVEPKVRMFERWYAGPRYHLLKGRVALNSDKLVEEFPWIPDLGLDEELSNLGVDVRSAALGLRVERDSRDSQFYPRRGSLTDLKLDFFDPAFGSTRDYQTRSVSASGFVGFKEKNVIAWRASVCSASDDAPFYHLCMLGKSADLRGYAVGKYQDQSMLVGQVEYRRELFWRLGAVAFLGAGEVAKSFSTLTTNNILPGGGIGARFKLTKESHVNFRVDYAWGQESSALYMGIFEAF